MKSDDAVWALVAENAGLTLRIPCLGAEFLTMSSGEVAKSRRGLNTSSTAGKLTVSGHFLNH